MARPRLLYIFITFMLYSSLVTIAFSHSAPNASAENIVSNTTSFTIEMNHESHYQNPEFAIDGNLSGDSWAGFTADCYNSSESNIVCAPPEDDPITSFTVEYTLSFTQQVEWANITIVSKVGRGDNNVGGDYEDPWGLNYTLTIVDNDSTSVILEDNETDGHVEDLPWTTINTGPLSVRENGTISVIFGMRHNGLYATESKSSWYILEISAEEVEWGCPDSTANNFNLNATNDDGSCDYDLDNDGIDDSDDTCPGFDDNIDTDNDGVADGCDPLIDSDDDGVADSEDVCDGHDDNIDADNDGVADGCDPLIDMSVADLPSASASQIADYVIDKSVGILSIGLLAAALFLTVPRTIIKSLLDKVTGRKKKNVERETRAYITSEFDKLEAELRETLQFQTAESATEILSSVNARLTTLAAELKDHIESIVGSIPEESVGEARGVLRTHIEDNVQEKRVLLEDVLYQPPPSQPTEDDSLLDISQWSDEVLLEKGWTADKIQMYRNHHSDNDDETEPRRI